ncbi:alpha-1,4-glucan--maltose-1-phosphate maltosyltransferase [Oceanidesulfovibrio marinus]|uniref:Alpha-1,4-glucan:maltose-1-phosphate maltosyltransferase n=1 Tax=Oceanidesulfovibrio marinus TaxID=370038 RepID=A0ABX6NFE2_9BACT|nr:alpha-1,4-glucan--maltose-1-phosphate maltosyltransferase [Oceanidesulfovibrio marinus]QJT09345.1 alpha-1,4-glucan--maltose-1-phosphate maltosyltransferase [Oceanidesulfovibrio marinus]
MFDGKKRVVIENPRPRVDDGRFPAKRALYETVEVKADILVDGHDALRAVCLFRRESEQEHTVLEMTHLVNDLWTAEFQILAMERYYFTIRAWVDPYASWLNNLRKKHEARQDVAVELADGALLIEQAAARAPVQEDRENLHRYAAMLRESAQGDAVLLAGGAGVSELMARYPDPNTFSEYGQELVIEPEPAKAAFSTWYEVFPRSTGMGLAHGTFATLEELLPRIAAAGFDVVYLPPVHPIGSTFRKGKDNSPDAGPDDVGSPWAIGSEDGGHKSVHPQLGTMEDFERLVTIAKDKYGIDVAIDIAFQCSPDHPYVQEHPEWFRMRSDGTIQYAENPPKKYQDVYPFNFECDDWIGLWAELKSIFKFWIERGVRIFRVDNPHTKPLPFWEWCLGELRKEHPEIIYLSEAFTRPKIMYRLAKAGFTHSYTYFTWRNSKQELTQYLTELVEHAPRDYFRPNFWPNTPDILPEYLQYGGRPAFIIRLVLAATLSSNYGIYGPAFELCENEAVPGTIDYVHSEKYEIRDWNLEQSGTLWPFLTLVNRIRRENPALQQTWNLRFLPTDNDFVIFFAKESSEKAEPGSEVILVAVNLDPHNPQTATLTLPLEEYGIDESQTYMVHDLLGDDKFVWQGRHNRLDFDPRQLPARIFRLKRKLKRETDFDYFM